MKKLGLGLLGLIVVTVVYYFTLGSSQVTQRLQQQLDTELSKLQLQGFSVSDREVKDNKEHFIISLDEPKMAAAFFTQQGMQFSTEETQELKGFKLGVEVAYLRDAVALELYPAALPTHLKTSLAKENDKQILAQIEKMIERKTLLMHVDIDHDATTFKGYMKDINETVQGEQETKLSVQGVRFSGEFKDEKVIKLKQTFHSIHLYVSGGININLSGLQSSYAHTGTTAYDHTADYSIEKIKINRNTEASLLANKVTLLSTSSVKNGLASETLKTKIKNIEIMYRGDKTSLQTLVFDMKVDNLDVNVFEKLQKANPDNKEEFDALLQKLISNNLHLEISTLSADTVTLREKEIPGFALHSKITIDKSLNIYRLHLNPMHTLDQINANLNVSLSKELLDVIAEDPKAMIAFMIFKPKKVLDKRIYDLKLNNGSLRVNGKPILF